MKFSPVVFWSAVRLTLHARPAVQSEGAENDETGKPYCDYDRNVEKKKAACARPGNKSISYVYDDGWIIDGPVPCDNALCCAKDAGMTDGSCNCVHAGGDYTGAPYSTPEKCCALGNFDAEGKCGEALVGWKLQQGGVASDCQSGALEKKDMTCIKQHCTVAGHKPQNNKPCCRSLLKTTKTENANVTVVIKEYEQPMYGDGMCGCIHAGHSPASGLDHVGGNNCCSVRLGTGGKCSCIDNEHEELIFGANKDDCCTKETVDHHGKLWCKSDKCLGLGSTLEGGAVCCSGVSNNGVCGCVAPGKAIPADQEAGRTCCSGEADHDDNTKCGHLHVGDTYNPDFMDASVCFSGRGSKSSDDTAEATCLCIHDGTVSHEPSECCSKWHDKDKKCGCLPAGAKMEDGAEAGDCCSRYSEHKTNQVCGCVLPGRPSRSHLAGKECCSNSTTLGHCGCFGGGASVEARHKQLCCNGAYNHTDLSCTCLPEGTAVGSYVHDAACCANLKNVGGLCKKP